MTWDEVCEFGMREIIDFFENLHQKRDISKTLGFYRYVVLCMYPEKDEKECWALLKFAQDYPSGNLSNHCTIHIAKNLLTFTERKSWDDAKGWLDPIEAERILGPNYLEEWKIREIFTSIEEMSPYPNISDIGLMFLIMNEQKMVSKHCWI